MFCFAGRHPGPGCSGSQETHWGPTQVAVTAPLGGDKPGWSRGPRPLWKPEPRLRLSQEWQPEPASALRQGSGGTTSCPLDGRGAFCRFLLATLLSRSKMLLQKEREWKIRVITCSVASVVTLCVPVDGSSPGSSVHGTFQARILEWVAMPSPGDLANSEIQPMSLMFSALAGGFFTNGATWEAQFNLKRTLTMFTSPHVVCCLFSP